MDTFYTDLPRITRISQLTDSANYRPAPNDWLIAVTDVRGSTKAIAEGRYKELNSVAAAAITALLNTLPDIDLPFVFGGDGAAMLIPPEGADAAMCAMRGVQRLAEEQFGFHLRAGLVPVVDVVEAGHSVYVAKLWMGENFQQALFNGGGISHAEWLLKNTDRYDVPPEVEPDADFNGFECRWNAVPSPHGEAISLIVQAHDAETYTDVLRTIDAIYGDMSERHPITVDAMRLMVNPLELSIEARVRYGTQRLGTLLKIAASSLLGWFLMRFDINGWGAYKPNFLFATDHEKFDDVLRMTIAGSEAQRERLTAFLEAQQQAHKLVYGLHNAPRTLVTCIVFDYFGRQVHLVDAEGGGYTEAARQLKTNMARYADEGQAQK